MVNLNRAIARSIAFGPRLVSEIADALGHYAPLPAARGEVGRLVTLAARPHTYLPMQAYAEASLSSRLFQYYLLDTHGFQPNVFTARIPVSTKPRC